MKKRENNMLDGLKRLRKRYDRQTDKIMLEHSKAFNGNHEKACKILQKMFYTRMAWIEQIDLMIKAIERGKENGQ